MSLPPLGLVDDEPHLMAMVNATGQDLVEGDVVCWDTSTSARTDVALTSATNRYRPAGIVPSGGCPSGESGWLYVSGRPVQALVLGKTGLVAGTPLNPVNGQTYLQGPATMARTEGVRYVFVLMETYETAVVALKAVALHLEGSY